MSDLTDLTDYVIEHPDAYEFRWRLAKKLYMAWEYNEALKHLLILKKDWARKLNVLRYLAATYYRLGRYEEALTELQEILRQWPTEIPVWEQLARVNEVAGKPEAAIQAWEEVLRLDPNHAIAGRAIQRLRSAPESTPRGELHLTDSDSGINLSVTRVCENCGAQNSEEFDRCWQCHASLITHRTPSSIKKAPPVPSSKAWLRTLAAGAITVAAFSASVYLALRHAPLAVPTDGVQEPPETVYDLIAEEFYAPRMVLFAVLFLVSPATLWVGFRLFKASGPTLLDTFGSGLFIASVTYLASWLPVSFLPCMLAVPALGSLLAVASLSGSTTWPRGTGIWVFNVVVLTAVTVGAVIGLVGAAPVRQWPEIARYSRINEASAGVGKHTLPIRRIPKATYSLTWLSTGSAWLDQRGNIISVAITPEPETQPISLEFSRGTGVEFYTETTPFRFVQPVDPGQQYELIVRGPENTVIHGLTDGLLDLKVGP